jgi:hypothetical protein
MYEAYARQWTMHRTHRHLTEQPVWAADVSTTSSSVRSLSNTLKYQPLLNAGATVRSEELHASLHIHQEQHQLLGRSS